jgi:hypothetical protein
MGADWQDPKGPGPDSQLASGYRLVTSPRHRSSGGARLLEHDHEGGCGQHRTTGTSSRCAECSFVVLVWLKVSIVIICRWGDGGALTREKRPELAQGCRWACRPSLANWTCRKK